MEALGPRVCRKTTRSSVHTRANAEYSEGRARNSCLLWCLRGAIGLSEFKPEAGALPRLGFKANPAAHAFKPFSDEGKADASSGIGVVRMEALKEAKNFLMIL